MSTNDKIEYQPSLWETIATDLLRQDFERSRRSWFVRFDNQQKKIKELEHRCWTLENQIANNPKEEHVGPKEDNRL